MLASHERRVLVRFGMKDSNPHSQRAKTSGTTIALIPIELSNFVLI